MSWCGCSKSLNEREREREREREKLYLLVKWDTIEGNQIGFFNELEILSQKDKKPMSGGK